MLFKQQKD